MESGKPRIRDERMSVTPRPLSARQRGIKAPYIRTSLSPDLVLRRRLRKLRRRKLAAQLATSESHASPIIISDDEETVSRTTCSHHRQALQGTQSTAMQVGPSRLVPQEVVDLTRLPTTPPPDPPSPIPSTLNLDVISPTTAPATGKRPYWLRACIGQMYSDYKDVKCHIIDVQPQGGRRKWVIECEDCLQVIPAGPGHTINDFREHLRLAHGICNTGQSTQSQRRVQLSSVLPPVQPPQHATPGPALSSADAVTAFLAEQGLSADLAPALRAVGISDLPRMRNLGRLPDVHLDRLEEALEKESVDLGARLLVREGLRRLARHSA